MIPKECLALEIVFQKYQGQWIALSDLVHWAREAIDPPPADVSITEVLLRDAIINGHRDGTIVKMVRDTTVYLMRQSDFRAGYSVPLEESSIYVKRVVQAVNAAVIKRAAEKQKEMNFFRSSAMPNTCPKCSAPLPCKYH